MARNGMPKLVEVAQSYLWVREVPPGSNRSPDIDRWLKALGSPLGSAWCAAFAWGCLDEAGEKPALKRSGRVQDMVDSGTLLPASKAEVGDLVVFWFESLKRYAHIGIVCARKRAILETIEGNTIPDGATGDTREGFGVFAKRRAISERVKVLRPK